MPAVRTRSSPTYPLRAQKTVTFDGTAGNGAIGTVTVFTITGRVYVRDLVIACTSTLVGATATIQCGIAGLTGDQFNASVTATNLATGDFWGGANDNPNGMNYGTVAASSAAASAPRNKAAGANIQFTVGTAAITGGTLVVDCWYEPLTSGGLLT